MEPRYKIAINYAEKQLASIKNRMENIRREATDNHHLSEEAKQAIRNRLETMEADYRRAQKTLCELKEMLASL